jgi:hypothetical protein
MRCNIRLGRNWFREPGRFRLRSASFGGTGPPSRHDDWIRLRVPAALIRPGVAFAAPKRGRRECRVRAAPAVSCAKECAFGAHEHTGERRTLRHPLRNGFTAYSALSPATNSSCHRRQRISGFARPVEQGIASADLTPATGARTTRLHRTQSAFAKGSRETSPPKPSKKTAKSVIRLVARENRSRGSSRPAIPCAPDAPRPPHPVAYVCDDRDTPLDRHGTGEL